MFISIKKILPLAAKRIGFKGEADLNEIKLAWVAVEKELFGQKTIGKVVPSKVKNKTLFISCFNSVWANELLTKQSEIVNALNSILKENKVEKVRFAY